MRKGRSNFDVATWEYTTKSVQIPKKLHGVIIGKGGGDGIREIRDTHGVRIRFPGKESYDETVEVSGRDVDVDGAITALTTKMQALAHDKKLEIPFPYYMIRYPILEEVTARLKVIGQAHGVHLTTPVRGKSLSGLYIAIKGADPNMAACKRQVQDVLADVEADYAMRTKEECSATSEENHFLKILRDHELMSVAKYYSDENQKKLKDFREGKCDWEPTSFR